ncbi:MAG TPA: host-nuclease inhibitor Gam family protein, partial [Spirochaetia bacterium]|nr:host-nuclease inhibitor Gam family protein [Spirochaetia bacterium]
MSDAIVPSGPDDIDLYVDEEDAAVRGRTWMIKDLPTVDWALRRLAECNKELAQIDALEEIAIRRVRENAEKARRASRGGVAYMTFQLLAWMDRNKDLVVRGTKKSRRFINGVLGYRGHGERLEVEDKGKVTEWLQTLPPESPMLRLKREAEMSAVQANFQATGEIPPG